MGQGAFVGFSEFMGFGEFDGLGCFGVVSEFDGVGVRFCMIKVVFVVRVRFYGVREFYGVEGASGCW